MILKDIMLRKNINDESTLKNIVEYSLDNIGNLLSTNNITNTMTSSGRKINVRTVEKYFDSLVEAYFLYKVKRYDVYIRKIDDLEVDFLAINNLERIYIQVCETLKDNTGNIIRRELNSLNIINDNYKKMILTSDKINTYNEEGIIIKNVLNWLLENETNKNT